MLHCLRFFNGQVFLPALTSPPPSPAEPPKLREIICFKNFQDFLSELNRYEKETGKSSGALNSPAGKPISKGGSSSPVMRAVRTKIRQETGKPAGQQKKVRGDKSSTETTPVDRIKRSLENKRDSIIGFLKKRSLCKKKY